MATEFQRRKIDLAFALLDVDGDGFLTEQDFVLLGRRWTGRAGDEDHAVRETMLGWWQVLSAAADGSDQVSLDDVLGVVDVLPTMPHAVDGTAEAMFAIVDANGDGEVDHAEYKQMIETFGGRGVDTAAAFDQLDLNGDGRISREEFRANWYEFWAGTDPSHPGRLLFGPVEAV
ncbi:EF-hand domain-containing protein [Streptomyces sp. NPDC089919]|uniref:EF-hand domain-containing protein n=1 Tax=Streptomyces sp. NPDC089919 TaxID=3155188 RepID=UPI003414BAEF